MKEAAIGTLGAPAIYAENETLAQTHLLEMYKLYVEMADRTSARRNQANAFFLTIHSSGIAAGVALHSTTPLKPLVMIGFPFLLGILLCILWGAVIKSYRQLNAAKYKVVGELEQRLPASPYWQSEWTILGEGRQWRKYIPISHVESWLPVLFMLLYLGLAACFLFIQE